MSKRNARPDTRQLSLLDAIAAAEQLRRREPCEGELCHLEERIRHALADAMTRAPLSRYQIAGEVSSLLGREVSKDMLDKYTSPAAPHHCPPDVLAAICRVTRSTEAIHLQAEAAGLFCLPGPEALRAEIQHLREQERKVGAERRKREAFLSRMEEP